MREESLFLQLRFVRKRTVAALEATTEEMADTQTDGFLNTNHEV